jgi:hypothetical protein
VQAWLARQREDAPVTEATALTDAREKITFYEDAI